MNPRRLYRSRDRQLAGVAGGMAEYLDIDPTVMRILWIIVGVVTGGLALIAYILLALVIPPAPYLANPAPAGWGTNPGWGPAAGTGWTTPPAAPQWSGTWAQPAPRAETRGFGAAAVVGVVLVVFGAIALADAAIPGWVAGAILGPAVILALGAALLIASIRRPAELPVQPVAPVSEPVAGPAPVARPAPVAEPVQAPVPAPAAAPWDETGTQPVDLPSSTGPA